MRRIVGSGIVALALVAVSAGVTPVAKAAVSPRAFKIKLYRFAVSTSADCSNPLIVYENNSPEYADFATNPTLGSGNIPDGTYQCVMMEMSDLIRFTPDAAEGACVSGQEYTTDVCVDRRNSGGPPPQDGGPQANGGNGGGGMCGHDGGGQPPGPGNGPPPDGGFNGPPPDGGFSGPPPDGGFNGPPPGSDGGQPPPPPPGDGGTQNGPRPGQDGGPPPPPPGQDGGQPPPPPGDGGPPPNGPHDLPQGPPPDGGPMPGPSDGGFSGPPPGDGDGGGNGGGMCGEGPSDDDIAARQLDGTKTMCSVSEGSESRVVLYLSTGAAHDGKEEKKDHEYFNPFAPPKSDGDKVRGIRLGAPLVVTGAVVGTFIVDSRNSVGEGGGECGMNPPRFSFE